MSDKEFIRMLDIITGLLFGLGFGMVIGVFLL